MTTEIDFEKQALNTFLSQIAKEADNKIRYFIIGFFLLGLLIAPFYDTWLFALGIGGLSMAAYGICIYLIPGTLASRMVISLIFAVYMLQFIGQMHGMYEMHFFFFINIAILIIYQDWRVMIPYTVFAIAHHIFFFALQLQGYDTGQYFISAVDANMITLLFHFGLAALMALVCGWWAFILNMRTLVDFGNKYRLENQLVDVNRNIVFAEEIKKGNLQYEYEINERDQLGKSLLSMRDSLLIANEREVQERFRNIGMAELADIVRKSNTDIATLAIAVITYLVKYMEANQGGFFTLKEENANDTYLELSGCYAYNRRKHLEKRITIGEGLVGQACLEKDTIYITDIPEDYITITSGLGEANPRSLLIVPIKAEEKVVGVIELASFELIPDYKISFLERATESLATTLITANINHRTKQLVATLQQQTEEMRASEEEMRQNMEELSATQEEINRREIEQKQEIERLTQLHQESIEKFKRLSLVADNTDNSVVITNPEGLIEYVNNGFTKMTGYSLEEVMGKKPGSFLQGVATNPETVIRIREKLNRQESFHDEILNYDKKGNEYWIAVTINPVFENNKLSKYISVQSDITMTKLKSQEFTAQMESIGRSNSIITFDLKGYVISANDNFLELMGYTLDEIVGRHHRTFVFADESETDAYKMMWENLGNGEFVTGDFRRRTKQGKEIWINGSYTAILDLLGRPYKVMKFAQDITVQKVLEIESQLQNEQLKAQEEELRQNMEELVAGQEDMQKKTIELNGVISAIDSTLANIEFDMQGYILAANENFLNAMGYQLKEIKGKHHKMFVDTEYARSKEYTRFWDELNFGKAQIGEVKRYTKEGEEIWFSASYTPVMDNQNKPFKVIKFAQNITQQKELALDFESQMAAIEKSYAIVEFDTQGNILRANPNFLELMGYGIDEIRGRHHKMFVNKEEANSEAYQTFWEKLNNGEYISNEFSRIAKSGKQIIIKGSYSPIKNMRGEVYKIVKYALELKKEYRPLQNLVSSMS